MTESHGILKIGSDGPVIAAQGLISGQIDPIKPMGGVGGSVAVVRDYPVCKAKLPCFRGVTGIAVTLG